MEQQQFQINVDLSSLPKRVCANCGSEIFVPAIRLMEISALLNPSGKAGVIYAQDGFICSCCGERADLTPKEENPSILVALDGGHA